MSTADSTAVCIGDAVTAAQRSEQQRQQQQTMDSHQPQQQQQAAVAPDFSAAQSQDSQQPAVQAPPPHPAQPPSTALSASPPTDAIPADASASGAPLDGRSGAVASEQSARHHQQLSQQQQQQGGRGRGRSSRGGRGGRGQGGHALGGMPRNMPPGFPSQGPSPGPVYPGMQYYGQHWAQQSMTPQDHHFMPPLPGMVPGMGGAGGGPAGSPPGSRYVGSVLEQPSDTGTGGLASRQGSAETRNESGCDSAPCLRPCRLLCVWIFLREPRMLPSGTSVGILCCRAFGHASPLTAGGSVSHHTIKRRGGFCCLAADDGALSAVAQECHTAGTSSHFRSQPASLTCGADGTL